MHYLYRITDTLNNKVYIGQSNKENERWRQHKYFARQEKPIQYVHRAIKKYGVDHFAYEVIACCKTQEDTDATETLLIEQYDSCNKEKGYNIAPGGNHAWNAGLPPEMQPGYGRVVSEETKKKISESNMGKIMPLHSSEWKEYMSKIMTGRTLPPEQVEKIARSNRGQKRSEEVKLKLSNAHKGDKHHNYGKSLSETTRMKIAVANTGKTKSKEERDRLALLRVGKTHSDQTKLKMSKARQGKRPYSKLNEDQVREIKALLSDNIMTQKEIGERYDVSRATIGAIKIGRSWK
jgi:group I intron endonuclease